MLNLLTKTKPWMVASLIVATSVFGQNNASCPKPCPPKPCPKPCPQPCPPTQVCPQEPSPCCPAWPTPVLNAAYNYPARIQTRCPWDFFADATFIYWQAVQDNMELGLANSTAAVGAGSLGVVNANVINMNFDFKPGFKVGLGGNFAHDNWDMYLEYTWYHTHNTQSSNGPAAPGQIAPMWGVPSLNGPTALYNTASESWRLKMDIIDLDLGRWYYVGTNLIFRPSFGARADWIRQRVTVDETRTAVTGGPAADTVSIFGKSSSWAIGPKVGLDTNWNIGSSFRIYGNGEADLTFTKYTRLRYSETHTNSVNTFLVKQSRVYAVRPHLDLELGMGWGMYLDCNNWYMDFSAGYEFQVFFDQNMFRHYTSGTMLGNSNLPNGNLYTQGLNVKFRLDF